MILANCKVSILRGTGTDEFGDPMDLPNAVATGVNASIVEVRSIATTISEGTPRQVRFLVGRVPLGTDIRHEDRIHDEETGQVYVVDAIQLSARSPIMNLGQHLDLRRVT